MNYGYQDELDASSFIHNADPSKAFLQPGEEDALP